VKQDKISILKQYLPEQSAPIIAAWIDDYACEFKISKTRNTKLGDYRPPFRGSHHRISVNYNLNPYAFLITTVHEFAHLVTWNAHQNRIKPHGTEWKNTFKKMMLPFYELDIFPLDVKKAVVSYLQNPAASSCADKDLYKTLKRYDAPKEDVLHVEDVLENQHFTLPNGREFKKLNKIRTRFRCLEVKTGRMYLFNPLAEVKLVG
jgi:hypothetical protein